MSKLNKVAIFPGSFDPFTNGHEDIVLRGLQIFDRIVIAFGHNSNKTRYFDLDMMLEKVRANFIHLPNIEVIIFDELTALLAKRYKANFLLRGLRNTTDFEYENSISQVNRYLNDGLETVFLITSPKYAAISSSIIREVHKYGGDVSSFIPYRL